jgi:hypothetical protein
MKQGITLEVTIGGEVVFQSEKHWLFPLFDLIDYTKQEPARMDQAEIHDRIIGLAAALLMLYLGVGCVHGDLMSELAIDAFQRSGVRYSFEQSVKRIECSTESSLLGVDDPEEAYLILCKQADRC